VVLSARDGVEGLDGSEEITECQVWTSDTVGLTKG
jgi:hypothetical protein